MKKHQVIFLLQKKKTKNKTQRNSDTSFSNLLVYFSVRQYITKRVRQLIVRNVVLSSMLFIFLSSGLFVFIQTQQGFSATFADQVLRPLIGSNATISIEAFYFNLQDNFNRFSYDMLHQPKARALAETQPTPTPTVAPQPESFSLSSISPVITDTVLPNEGIWTPLRKGTGSAVMAKTVYRPDTQRPYAVATMVKLNMDKLAISAVAGTKEPGEEVHPGPGLIPLEIQHSNNLVAAFNGGFQKKDGQYGMVVGDHTYLPLQKNMATLLMFADDTPQIIRFTGQSLPDGITAIRQNGPMLIENGQIVTSASAWNMQTWGLTITNTMYTWRSGLGVTATGDLIYACGPSLVPETLAAALQAAGAVDAMQLDINPYWVRFVLFTSQGEGKYLYTPLIPEMVNGGYPYLHGYQKDFFYVYKK